LFTQNSEQLRGTRSSLTLSLLGIFSTKLNKIISEQVLLQYDVAMLQISKTGA